jgi:hypothetical protein
MRIQLKLPGDLQSATRKQILLAYELAAKKQKKSIRYGLVCFLIALSLAVSIIAVKAIHLPDPITILVALLLAGIAGLSWGVTQKYLRFRLVDKELRKMVRTNGSTGSPINPAPGEP